MSNQIIDSVRTNSVAQRDYTRQLASLVRHHQIIWDVDDALAQDPDVYETIRRDPETQAAMNLRQHFVAGRTVNTEPATDSDDDQKAATVMEAAIGKVQNFAQSRKNLAAAVFKGQTFALICGRREIVEVPGIGKVELWVPKQLHDVDKRRVRQISTPEGIKWQLFSPKKDIWENMGSRRRWFVYNTYNNTEDTFARGRGLVEAIYFYQYAKTEFLQLLLSGGEKWAEGMVTAAIDGLRSGSTERSNDDIVTSWLNSIERMRSRHSLVHDKLDELKVLWPDMAGADWAIKVITYLDQGKTRLILGSVLPSGGASEAGSFARAQVEENTTEALVQFDRDDLSENLTRDLMGLTWEMNRTTLFKLGLQNANMPRLKIVNEKREDAAEAATVAATLLSAGVKLRADEVYEKTGYTMPGPEDSVIEQAPAEIPFTSPFNA